MKTHQLTGVALDWAVAQCEEVELVYDRMHGWWETSDPYYAEPNDPEMFSPSTNWAQGGPIIEREKIELEHMRGAGDAGEDVWVATRMERPAFAEASGSTMLEAAMRCYVESKLGDEVEIPEELLTKGESK